MFRAFYLLYATYTNFYLYFFTATFKLNQRSECFLKHCFNNSKSNRIKLRRLRPTALLYYTTSLWNARRDTAPGGGWWIFSACLTSPRRIQGKHPATISGLAGISQSGFRLFVAVNGHTTNTADPVKVSLCLDRHALYLHPGAPPPPTTSTTTPSIRSLSWPLRFTGVPAATSSVYFTGCEWELVWKANREILLGLVAEQFIQKQYFEELRLAVCSVWIHPG